MTYPYNDNKILGDGRLRDTGALCHIDASMFVHRTDLLKDIATWDPHTAGDNWYAMDGVLIQKWLDAGVEFVFVPEVTVEYLQVGYHIDGGGVPQ